MALAPSVIINLPGYPFDTVLSVSNTAALRALPSSTTSNGFNVVLDGAASSGDGGGGLFVYNSASLATDDGVTVVKPNDKTTLQAGRWIGLSLSGAALAFGATTIGGSIERPLTYYAGADPSGVTSSNAALVSANAAGPIRVIGGVFRITSSITLTKPLMIAPDSMFVIATGVTLILNGPFHAMQLKCFELEGTGRVQFNGGAVVRGVPEWFGAKVDDSTARVANTLAINNCLSMIGSCYPGKGIYYMTTGAVLSAYNVLEGYGENQTAFLFSSPTSHMFAMRGSGGVYLECPILRNINGTREVNPTTPALEADDINQGHGLSLDLVSNPIIESVRMVNNLVDVYVHNALSPKIKGILGLRLLGGAGDRYYGCITDGRNIGPFGGPSANPSARLTQLHFSNASAVGRAWGHYAVGSQADLWIFDLESGSCHIGGNWDAAGAGTSSMSDVIVGRYVHDAYKTDGAKFKDFSAGTGTFAGFYSAPAVGATGNALVIDNCRGITITGYKAIAETWGALMTAISLYNNCKQIKIEGRVNNFGSIMDNNLGSMNCTYVLEGYKAAAPTAGAQAVVATQAIRIVGGSGNTVKLSTDGPAGAWQFGVNMDASTLNNQIDVTGVSAVSSGRVARAGGTITTQGQQTTATGGHLIIDPGKVWATAP